MLQPDYRDGVEDDCQDSLIPVLEEILPQISGASQGHVTDVLKRTAKEFFRLSWAWRTFLDIGTLTEGEMPYDINPLADANFKAIAIIDLSIEGLPVARGNIGTRTQSVMGLSGGSETTRPMGYFCDPPTTINFIGRMSRPVENIVATIAIIPMGLTTDIPQWVVDNFSEALVSGTLWRLYNEADKPYSNVGKAMYYGKLWRFHVAQGKTIADKNFGTAQHDWLYPRGTM